MRRLLSDGRRVRCLVHPSETSRRTELGDAEVVTGDIREPRAVRAAVDGAERVFHLAAAQHPAHAAEYHAVNHAGTEALVRAAAEAGAGRLVHVSSIAIHGHNTSGAEPFTEDSPARPSTRYATSKWAGEVAARRVAAETGLSLLVLRPGPFYGPGLSASLIRLAALVRAGHMPHFGRGAWLRSFAHVDNVLDALLLAESAALSAGEPLLVADATPYSTWELLHAVADALACPLRVPALSPHLARICEGAARAVDRAGWHAPTLTMAGEFGRHTFCRIDRAREMLGYAPTRSLSEGIREAIDEARAAGRL